MRVLGHSSAYLLSNNSGLFIAAARRQLDANLGLAAIRQRHKVALDGAANQRYTAGNAEYRHNDKRCRFVGKCPTGRLQVSGHPERLGERPTWLSQQVGGHHWGNKTCYKKRGENGNRGCPTELHKEFARQSLHKRRG